ncbi:DUF4956 domain-containing protein [Crenothrix polyspora]|uniref:DUF4956 domain-containing protein n=1 Tax=Crenothrix polyspora TaxID=360316 RepID=A0A1R4H2I0_9GAMM|nr:DUF4956 domain-containing protein [Crenothrix polyspora]SJM90386.1 conserved membrane hypothetical protein [Crenothrix polyspora]
MFDSVITVHSAAENASVWTLIFTILLAFVLSTLLAYVYQKTFRGLSYSRNYIQSIVLISIIAAVVIQSVGDSMSRGIGIMAAMSIIRFRTNFKDPRDTLFMFAALAEGISCGAYAFPVAIVGTLGFSIASIILYYSPLGPNSYFDGMLRFNLPLEAESKKQLEFLLDKYCRVFALVTLREVSQGKRLDYAYHIKLRKKMNYEDFMIELKAISGLEGLSLMMQEATVDL